MRSVVSDAVEQNVHSQPYLADVLPTLARRSRRNAEAIAGIRALHSDERLTRSLSEVASSHIHMAVNRLLRASHRRQELMLYDFLLKHYESVAARAGGKASREQGTVGALQTM